MEFLMIIFYFYLLLKYYIFKLLLYIMTIQHFSKTEEEEILRNAVFETKLPLKIDTNIKSEYATDSFFKQNFPQITGQKMKLDLAEKNKDGVKNKDDGRNKDGGKKERWRKKRKMAEKKERWRVKKKDGG